MNHNSIISVSAPQLSHEGRHIRCTFKILNLDSSSGSLLWFEVPAEYENFLSQRSDAAMVAMIVPAMQADKDLFIEGIVSKKLLAEINTGKFQEILIRAMPKLKRITVRAESTRDQPEIKPQYKSMGFSAGGDSFATLLASSSLGIKEFTHLTHYDVGSHGRGKAGKKVFQTRVVRVQSAARKIGLPVIPVNSNLNDFYDKETDFISTSVVRNAAATLVIQRGMAEYVFSGAYHRRRQGILLKGDITRAEDEFTPLLSTESLKFSVFGSDMTRAEKIVLIAKHPITYDLLDVCMEPRKVRNKINCSTCYKCLRAMINLEILGQLDSYAPVFDLKLYRRLRWWALAQFLNGAEESRAETEALARETGFEFPAFSKFCARPIPFWFARFAKKVIERIP